jgi:hypothetical protein
VAVDDAGFRGVEGRHAGQRRLHPDRFGAVQHAQPLDAVSGGLGKQLFQRRNIRVAADHHEFAEFLVRHTVGSAKFVEHSPRTGAVPLAK